MCLFVLHGVDNNVPTLYFLSIVHLNEAGLYRGGLSVAVSSLELSLSLQRIASLLCNFCTATSSASYLLSSVATLPRLGHRVYFVRVQRGIELGKDRVRASNTIFSLS